MPYYAILCEIGKDKKSKSKPVLWATVTWRKVSVRFGARAFTDIVVRVYRPRRACNCREPERKVPLDRWSFFDNASFIRWSPDRKELILIESGIRIHTTQFARDKATTPSSFCIKIRKHLRTRRLTDVRQLGSDRIVDFHFGGGDSNHEFRILSLLRVVQPNENIHMAVGEIYDTQMVARDFQAATAERLQEVLKKAGPKDVLKKLLNSAFDYGPALSEHAIIHAGLNPNMKISTEFDTSTDSPQFKALLDGLQTADRMILECGQTVQKHARTMDEEDPDALI
ncbi:hypothetical protein BC938DRAFT_472636, partial [Jimgerdemannia flammicorona]